MIPLVLFVSSFPLPLHLLNCAFVLPILLPSHSWAGVGSEVLCGCLAAGQGLYTTLMELQKEWHSSRNPSPCTAEISCKSVGKCPTSEAKLWIKTLL